MCKNAQLRSRVHAYINYIINIKRDIFSRVSNYFVWQATWVPIELLMNCECGALVSHTMRNRWDVWRFSLGMLFDLERVNKSSNNNENKLKLVQQMCLTVCLCVQKETNVISYSSWWFRIMRVCAHIRSLTWKSWKGSIYAYVHGSKRKNLEKMWKKCGRRNTIKTYKFKFNNKCQKQKQRNSKYITFRLSFENETNKNYNGKCASNWAADDVATWE